MDWDKLVQFSQLVVAVVAIWRLMGLHLAPRFPALVAWLAFLAVTQLSAVVLSRFSGIYFWVYVIYVPSACVFGILAVRELFVLAFARYPGIKTVGIRSMYAGLLLATLASLTIAMFFQRTSTHGSRHLFYFEVTQRSVVFSLVVVIATILFFLSRYPLQLGRNTYVSSAFFSFLFLSDAARLLIDSLHPQLHSDTVDLVEGAVAAVCLTTWACLLKEESALHAARVTFPSPQEDDLLAELASLNQVLSRTARR